MRDILAAEYEDVTVVTCSSGDDELRRFSSDTDMGEALILATRREAPGEEKPWRWVNLKRNPRTVAEGTVLAESIEAVPAKKTAAVKVGERDYGFCAVSGRATAPAMMRSPEVVDALLTLTDPERPGIELPRSDRFVDLPLAPLGELGTNGPIARDIEATARDSSRGPFLKEPHPGGAVDFPILWEHFARRNDHRERCLVVEPDVSGVIVSDGMKTKAAAKWKTASRLHINIDFRLTSQPLAACLTPEPVIGGRAWPSFILHEQGEPAVEKMDWVYPVVLWANTTLGLLGFYALGTRTQAGRTSLSSTRRGNMLVLDPRRLTGEQLTTAEDIFTRFKDREFKAAREASTDETRKALDAAMLGELLGLDGDVLERVKVIRDRWCREPHLTGSR